MCKSACTHPHTAAADFDEIDAADMDPLLTSDEARGSDLTWSVTGSTGGHRAGVAAFLDDRTALGDEYHKVVQWSTHECDDLPATCYPTGKRRLVLQTNHPPRASVHLTRELSAAGAFISIQRTLRLLPRMCG